jgi:hypothetical protein
MSNKRMRAHPSPNDSFSASNESGVDYRKRWPLKKDASSLVHRISQLHATDAADVVDRVVGEKNSSDLVMQLANFFWFLKQQPEHKSAQPQVQNIPRPASLRTGFADMTSDLWQLPLLCNGNGISGFLAAGIEMMEDKKSNRNFVVKFSAVQIPQSRGKPEPKIHLIVNPEIPGIKFNCSRYAVRHILGDERKDWKMYIPTTTFTSILDAYAEEVYFLFWGKKEEVKAVRNSYELVGKDGDHVIIRMIDIQPAILGIIAARDPRLQNNVQTLAAALHVCKKMMERKKSIPQEQIIYAESLLATFMTDDETKQKNSLHEAAAVAVMYNFYSEHLDPLHELLQRTNETK